jgi:hypothetical protein
MIGKHKFLKIRSIYLLVVFILFIHSAYSQEKPYFSGDWILNLDKSKLQAYWTAGLTYGNFKISHNEPKFSLWRTFTIKGKDKIMAYDIQINGQEQKGKHKTIWTLSWEQDTLVFVVKRHEMTIDSVRYSISPGRTEFIANERVDTPKLKYYNHWVFDKKTP